MKPVAVLTVALPEPVLGRISVRNVVEATAAHFKTGVKDLRSDSRRMSVTRPRMVAAYVARQTTGRSLPYIGEKLGGRDHTTVLHAVRTVQAWIDAGDAETVAAVDAIVSQLTGGAHV